MFSKIIDTNSTAIFKEDLSNYADFSTDPLHYFPLIDPKNKTFLQFFTPEEPYLTWEEKFDPSKSFRPDNPFDEEKKKAQEKANR